MGTYFKAIDRFAAALTRGVLARRWLVIAAAVLLAAVIGSGATRLEFSTNYRVFFSEANPELQAFENLQELLLRRRTGFGQRVRGGHAGRRRAAHRGGLANSLRHPRRLRQQLPAHLRDR